MLSVRTKVNSILSQKLRKDANAIWSDDKTKSNYLNMTAEKSCNPVSPLTINVDSLGEPQTEDDLSSGEQNAIISTIELKTYTPKGEKSPNTLIYARYILDKAGDVMLGIGYKLIYGPADISNGDYNTMVARFRRTLGNGDIENL